MNLEREFEPNAYCVNSGHQEADLARDDRPGDRDNASAA